MALILLHSKSYMSKKTQTELCTVCALLSKDVAFPVGDRQGRESSSKIHILEFFPYLL